MPHPERNWRIAVSMLLLAIGIVAAGIWYAAKQGAAAPDKSQVSQSKEGEKSVMVHPVEVTDSNFEAEISNYRGVALVDFWAEWCGPCRMMAPTVAELASDFQGRAKVAKLNVDENPETASAYGIMSIPTLIIFKDGRPVDKLIGVQPKSVLTQRIEKWLQ